jgi:hypothetical protein
MPNSSDRDTLAVLTAIVCQQGLKEEDLHKLISIDESRLRKAVKGLLSQGLIEHRQGYHPTPSGLGKFQDIILEISGCLDTTVTLAKYSDHVYEDPTPLVYSEAMFRDNIYLVFSIEPPLLRPLVPEPFQLDVCNERALISVTINSVKNIRLAWLPAMMGVNYYDVIYRAHVYYIDHEGRKRRGVYFLRTDSNSPFLNLMGRRLKEFKPHNFIDSFVTLVREREKVVCTVKSKDGLGDLVCVVDGSDSTEFTSNLFRGEPEARERIIDLHSAFALSETDNTIMILEIVRTGEEIRPIRFVDGYFGFLSRWGDSAKFDNAMYIENSHWKWLPLKKERIGPRV